MHSYITAIGTAVPNYQYTQPEIADFMAGTLNLDSAEKRKLSFLYNATGIKHRYSILNNFKEGASSSINKNSVTARMQLYKQHALPLALRSIKNCLDYTKIHKDQFTHLITVSCTGMYAPGLDIDIVKKMKLPSSINRTCINYMGCYAAFNALKAADSICKADPGAMVLIVCTELCSLHFQDKKDEDNLVANALFGDGSAAVIVRGQPDKGISLQMESFFCDLIPDGKKDMAWEITDQGFQMTLSSYIPGLIQGGITTLVNKLLKKSQKEKDQINYYAIHPGGRKILEVCATELAIPEDKLSFSYDILNNYGNMSSPTVLFVLKAILNQLSETDNNKNILGIAFGPGLTVESAILKAHYA